METLQKSFAFKLEEAKQKKNKSNLSLEPTC